MEKFNRGRQWRVVGEGSAWDIEARRVFLKRGSLRIRGHQPRRDTVEGMEDAKAPRWECAGQVPGTEEAGMAGTA